ncbi:hypothetical protein Tco_1080147 [Tanacetum coccineum]|uniref:Uncharacterized protein n=1 Tax=Tanacetum coccineum TaxID=301880 RepID=A0ABQ5HVJ7_9ASTR
MNQQKHPCGVLTKTERNLSCYTTNQRIPFGCRGGGGSGDVMVVRGDDDVVFGGVNGAGDDIDGGGGLPCRLWWRRWVVEARGGGDRIDPGRIYLFIILGLVGKSPPEKFSGGGGVAVAGNRWPAGGDGMRGERVNW